MLVVMVLLGAMSPLACYLPPYRECAPIQSLRYGSCKRVLNLAMKFTPAIVIVALVFLSSSALIRSAKRISDATGNYWGVMPQSLLQHSPFHSYQIPGIVVLNP